MECGLHKSRGGAGAAAGRGRREEVTNLRNQHVELRVVLKPLVDEMLAVSNSCLIVRLGFKLGPCLRGRLERVISVSVGVILRTVLSNVGKNGRSTDLGDFHRLKTVDSKSSGLK